MYRCSACGKAYYEFQGLKGHLKGNLECFKAIQEEIENGERLHKLGISGFVEKLKEKVGLWKPELKI